MEDMQTSIKDKVSTVFSFSFLFLVLGTSRMEVVYRTMESDACFRFNSMQWRLHWHITNKHFSQLYALSCPFSHACNSLGSILKS